MSQQLPSDKDEVPNEGKVWRKPEARVPGHSAYHTGNSDCGHRCIRSSETSFPSVYRKGHGTEFTTPCKMMASKDPYVGPSDGKSVFHQRECICLGLGNQNTADCGGIKYTRFTLPRTQVTYVQCMYPLLCTFTAEYV
jgi:hypothetical protein